MYTVFVGEGTRTPRTGKLGLVVFTRTLRGAVAESYEGDTIIGWTNSGGTRRTYRVQRAVRGTLYASPVK